MSLLLCLDMSHVSSLVSACTRSISGPSDLLFLPYLACLQRNYHAPSVELTRLFNFPTPLSSLLVSSLAVSALALASDHPLHEEAGVCSIKVFVQG